MTSPASTLRDRLLSALLDIAPDRGWTSSSIKEAAKAAGLTSGEVELAAPGGPLDMIDAFSDWADREALAKLAATDLTGMKVREKVTLAVRARIEAAADHRQAARRATAHLALMRDVSSPVRFAWRSADRLWRALGDTSTDENYYSKRAILAGVIASTVAFWMTDESAEFERTWSFLHARIENVMQFERLKMRLKPLSFLGWQAIGAIAAARYRTPQEGAA